MHDLAGPKVSLLRKQCIFFILLFVHITAGQSQGQSFISESGNSLSAKPWSFGAFGTGGWAIGYRDVQATPQNNEPNLKAVATIDMELFDAGVRASKVLTGSVGPLFLRGQLEAGMEVTPYWQAHYPRQALTYYSKNPDGTLGSFGTAPVFSENRFGVGFTPLLLRWDFAARGRVVPWAQLGGGLLWTNHKFPQYPYRKADTSVINFTPQAGIGANVFVRPRQSLFFGANAVHISSASLGDRNPGVNVTLQFTAGYSWWWK